MLEDRADRAEGRSEALEHLLEHLICASSSSST